MASKLDEPREVDSELLERIKAAKESGKSPRRIAENYYYDKVFNNEERDNRTGVYARPGKISKADCEEMKSMDESGVTRRAIADEFGVIPKTVRRHLSGDCEHKRHYIKPGVCDVMRILSDLGASHKFIAEFSGHNDSSSVIYHLYNDCSCSNSIPPAKRRNMKGQIDREECTEMRAKKQNGKSEEQIADEHFVPLANVKTHVRRQCSHK